MDDRNALNSELPALCLEHLTHLGFDAGRRSSRRSHPKMEGAHEKELEMQIEAVIMKL
jgi:hypothetical protein